MATAAERASKIKNRMSEMAGGMADGMHHMSDQAVEMAGQGMKQVRETLQDSMHSARRGLSRMEKSFEKTVAARPLISVSAALAIGMGIALGMWAIDCAMNHDR